MAVVIISLMMGPGEQLVPSKTKKNLHVTFADVRQERIFSKKTGKIKSDKISKT